MTRFDAIEINRDEDNYCDFCEGLSDYAIDYLRRNTIYICKKCLDVLNRKAALIDGNEEI